MDLTPVSPLHLLVAAFTIATIASIVAYRRRRRHAQEERSRVEEEATRAAEWRRQIEAKIRAVEEHLREADEERRNTEEERRRLEELARQEAEEAEQASREEAERKAREKALREARERETQEPKPEITRPEPVKRGGRPREQSKGPGEQQREEIRYRRPKPEVVCWKREREWVLGVEIPDELLASSALEVWQNSLPLTQEGSDEALWRLANATGEVLVGWNEDDRRGEARFLLDGKCLLFKLSVRTQNRGRRVRVPSSGTYLVIAPDDWERDETLAGPPIWTPETVSLAGYRAHYYLIPKNGNGQIAFRTALGESVVIKSEVPRFMLAGTQLDDASEDAAPLYGSEPPLLKTLDEGGWTAVGTIVVGEEGSGRQRWRMEFSPAADAVEQEMPPKVAARGGGWYFLRFYDSDGDLLESLDFRFLSAVREIRILQQPPLPPEGGHKPVPVEIICESALSLEPGDGAATHIQVERGNGKVLLSIPPDAALDETRWLMGAEIGPHLEVCLLVQRLWWAMSDENDPPRNWDDKQLSFSRGDFSATSRRALWIRLPRRRWVDKVLAGFVHSRARSLAVRAAERELVIPLREFDGSPELEDESQTHVLKLWVRDGEVAVGVVPGVPTPRPREDPPVVRPLTGQGWVGHGRHKTAIARAILHEGTGKITINGQSVRDYFKATPRRGMDFLRRLLAMSQVAELLAHKDASIVVNGGSKTSARQPKAVAHALARALMGCDFSLRPSLRRAGFGGVTVMRQARM